MGFKWMFGAMIMILIAGFAAMAVIGGSMYFGFDTMYVIDVPSYDGTAQTYFTSQYRIDPNTKCITFVDGLKFQRTVCNNYNIIRLK